MCHKTNLNETNPHISRTLLRILPDLINIAFWVASILPLISKCSSLLSNVLETIPSALTIIGITVIRFFYSLFLCLLAVFIFYSLARSLCLFIFSLSFSLSGPLLFANFTHKH